MVISRALLGTALGTVLGLSMAGCAHESPSAEVAQVNRGAATSVSRFSTLAPAAGPQAGIQVASLEAVNGEKPTPVIQKGTVLWRRSADETVPTPEQKADKAEIEKLRESLSQAEGRTSQQLAELERRLQANQQVAITEAVGNVSQLAQQSLRSMENMSRNSTENLSMASQQLAQLQAALAEVRAQQARTDERTQAYTDLKVSQSKLETQLAAVNEARQAAKDAEQRSREYTGLQLASRDQILGGLITANEANRRLTALQMAELRKLNAETRALATSEVTNVAAALRQYADAQLQQAAASTSATLTSLAQATDQSVAELRDQTNRRLGVLWQAANQNAAKMAEDKANAVAASLAALQQQTASERITPEQIRTISEETVANSTPEFRALALKTMQESQDYIRTIARTAVQDKDPGMQTALAEAARDVITKDDKVVFAIRKAVAEELQGMATETATTVPAVPVNGAAAPAMRLGPDHAAANGETAELDPNRLRIAQLLAPGSSKPAPDAANLAAISPASGPAPQESTGGQQSWSVPGTSLMRSRNRSDWMDIRQYKVVVHEDDQTLEQLLGKVIKHAEPFTGPWQLRWKVSDQNREILTEKFSLDAETSFEEFVSYLAQYVVNDRGVKLSFSLFDNERIIVVSD